MSSRYILSGKKADIGTAEKCLMLHADNKLH